MMRMWKLTAQVMDIRKLLWFISWVNMSYEHLNKPKKSISYICTDYFTHLLLVLYDPSIPSMAYGAPQPIASGEIAQKKLQIQPIAIQLVTFL